MEKNRWRSRKEFVSAARDWVVTEGLQIPRFCGAFLHGSILEKEEEALIPASSDVDLVVVLDDVDPPLKPGKLVHRDALLDVTYIPLDSVRTPELVLTNYHLAPSFARLRILADPAGGLSALHLAVADEFAKPAWVERRVSHARENVLDKLRAVHQPSPLHDRVMAWAFAAGVLCHILLVAALKNPTIRRRYIEVRSLLDALGRRDVYEGLLEVLGCARMGPERVAHHLSRMTKAFDAAKRAIKTPFFFATDISDIARPISIDGSRELIERGDHREAVFWIVATYCRCLKILAADAPGEVGVHSQGFAELISDLGIDSPEDLGRRAAAVEAALAPVLELARAMIQDPSLGRS